LPVAVNPGDAYYFSSVDLERDVAEPRPAALSAHTDVF